MCCFFFNDTATTEIYTLSLHDALPICLRRPGTTAHTCADRCLRAFSVPVYRYDPSGAPSASPGDAGGAAGSAASRSEEHTSELQSRQYLVCRLLLEKKNNQIQYHIH